MNAVTEAVETEDAKISRLELEYATACETVTAEEQARSETFDRWENERDVIPAAERSLVRAKAEKTRFLEAWASGGNDGDASQSDEKIRLASAALENSKLKLDLVNAEYKRRGKIVDAAHKAKEQAFFVLGWAMYKKAERLMIEACAPSLAELFLVRRKYSTGPREMIDTCEGLVSRGSQLAKELAEKQNAGPS